MGLIFFFVFAQCHQQVAIHLSADTMLKCQETQTAQVDELVFRRSCETDH